MISLVMNLFNLAVRVNLVNNKMDIEKNKLADVTRNTNFITQTNLIILDDTVGVVETVKDVTVIPDKPDIGVNISTTLSDISVGGIYLQQFNDYGEYVSEGSSDKIEEPTIFNDIGSLPPNKSFYMFEQDTTRYKTITYTVTIIYDKETTVENLPPTPPTVNIEYDLEYVGSFTHTVNNSSTLGYNVIKNYYK